MVFRLRGLLRGRPMRLVPGRFHDPNLLAVPNRIGRICHDTLVWADPGDFDSRPKIAYDTHVLDRKSVV